MLNIIDLVFIYLSIGFSLLSLLFIFLSLKLTRRAAEKGMLGSIFNLKYKRFEKFWHWVFLIPFVIIASKTTELIKEIQGFGFIDGFYRIFDFLIILIVFVVSFSYYFLLKVYMK